MLKRKICMFYIALFCFFSQPDYSQTFPTLSNSFVLERLKPPGGKVRMILDTDTYNEIDDQFAVVYALLSSDKLNLEAIHAAPFLNSRSKSPEDGMEKSYQEILKILKMVGKSSEGFAFRGSADFLSDYEHPYQSDAAGNLIKLAMASDDGPLYVVATGAITNVASALLIEPQIINHIVVIWLGGTPSYWQTAREFNLRQDLHASKLIFECGVPFVQIPCSGVASHLITTESELERYVKGKGKIGNYLLKIYRDYRSGYAKSKVIWDISAVAYLIDDSWVPTEIIHSPILTDQMTWSVDNSRHFIRSATFVNRDKIFGDFFKKLEKGF